MTKRIIRIDIIIIVYKIFFAGIIWGIYINQVNAPTMGFFKQIKALNDSIARLTATLSNYQSKEIPVEAISKELFAQYPDITEVSLSRGASVQAADSTANEQIIAFITTSKPMDAELHDRLVRWLKVRLDNENVLVVGQIEKAAE